MGKLTQEQLEDLADFEHSANRMEDNVDYIAYLWYRLQDYDELIASELQRDYKIYVEEIK